MTRGRRLADPGTPRPPRDRRSRPGRSGRSGRAARPGRRPRGTSPRSAPPARRPAGRSTPGPPPRPACETSVRSARVIRTPAIVSGPASVNSRRNPRRRATRSSRARTPASAATHGSIGTRTSPTAYRIATFSGVCTGLVSTSDDVVPVDRPQDPADPELAALAQALAAPHLVGAGAEAVAGRDHVQAARRRSAGRPRRRRHAVEQDVGQAGARARPVGKKPSVALPDGIGVDQEHPTVQVGQGRRQVDGRRALADAPFALVTATLRMDSSFGKDEGWRMSDPAPSRPSSSVLHPFRPLPCSRVAQKTYRRHLGRSFSRNLDPSLP